MNKVLPFLCVIAIFSCSFDENKTKKVKTYFPNGKIKSITEMENDKKNGKEELYWENGNIFFVQYFKNDFLVDSFYQYYQNDSGRIFLRGYSIQKSQVVTLDSMNNVVSVSDYREAMLPEGFVKLYYSNPDHNLWTIGEFRNGKKNGVDIEYYPDGNVKTLSHYKNGIKIPPVVSFDSTGKMIESKRAE